MPRPPDPGLSRAAPGTSPRRNRTGKRRRARFPAVEPGLAAIRSHGPGWSASVPDPVPPGRRPMASPAGSSIQHSPVRNRDPDAGRRTGRHPARYPGKTFPTLWLVLGMTAERDTNFRFLARFSGCGDPWMAQSEKTRQGWARATSLHPSAVGKIECSVGTSWCPGHAQKGSGRTASHRVPSCGSPFSFRTTNATSVGGIAMPGPRASRLPAVPHDAHFRIRLRSSHDARFGSRLGFRVRVDARTPLRILKYSVRLRPPEIETSPVRDQPSCGTDGPAVAEAGIARGPTEAGAKVRSESCCVFRVCTSASVRVRYATGFGVRRHPGESRAPQGVADAAGRSCRPRMHGPADGEVRIRRTRPSVSGCTSPDPGHGHRWYRGPGRQTDTDRSTHGCRFALTPLKGQTDAGPTLIPRPVNARPRPVFKGCGNSTGSTLPRMVGAAGIEPATPTMST